LNNLKETIGGPSHIFVKFYSGFCGRRRYLWHEVTFGGVERRENKKICDSQKKGIEFTGTSSVGAFCDVPGGRGASRHTVDLHPLNFDETVNNTKCLFVTFSASLCGHCTGSRSEEQGVPALN
jgi:hypothetical protein